MNSESTVNTLNDLIATSEDGKKGFEEAARDATAPDLKAAFRQRAAECDAAVSELQAMVQSIGGKPESSGTIAGAAHRGWVKVKSAVGSGDLAVLEEVERGEDHAKAVYAKALKSELPATIRQVVRIQSEGVIRNHDRIRDLRNRYRASAHA